MRHAQSNVITASVDNLKFIRGVYQGDLLVLIGKMTYVGNTSMEVRVDTYVETLDGMRRPVNRAYLVQVAVDQKDKPVRVPGLIVGNGIGKSRVGSRYPQTGDAQTEKRGRVLKK